jgi:DNA-binding MarR family transcriptional regulator
MTYEGQQGRAIGGAVDFGPMSSAIIRLARAHRALAAQLMKAVGLGPDQGALMMHLWSVGPVRQTALAAHFGRDSASTTRTVQRLEHAGFVRRDTDPTDRRATLVRPTAAGTALRPRVEAIWLHLEEVVRSLPEHDEPRTALETVTELGDLVEAALPARPSMSLADL